MSDSHDGIVRTYEGALRAIDTKAQIFLAFITITVAPVSARLAEFGAAALVRIGVGVLFAATVACFAFCLYPRRGRRPTAFLFDITREGAEVGAHVMAPGFTQDVGATITVLHDIYRIKVRSVTAGIVLFTAYVLTTAAALALI